MKKKTLLQDYVKANRKGSRSAEIEQYGHAICHKKVHKSKKVYNRKRVKAGDKNLPLFFIQKSLVLVRSRCHAIICPISSLLCFHLRCDHR